MNDLIKLIYKKSGELSNTDISNKDEEEFLGSFLKNFNLKDYNSYNNITPIIFLTSVLLANHIDMDYKKFMDKIYNIKEFINSINYNDVEADLYMEYMELLKLKLEKENTMDSVEVSKTNSKIRKIARKLFSYEDDKGKIIYDEIAQKSFDEIFKTLPEINLFISFFDLEALIEITNAAKESINTMAQELKEDASNVPGKLYRELSRKVNRDTKKMISSNINVFLEYDENYIKEYYDSIVSHHENLYRDVRDEIKDINKKVRKLQSLCHYLTTVDSKTLMKLNSDIEKMLFDPEVKYNYMLVMLQHNFNIQSKAEEQNKEYNNNTFTKLDIIFSKFGYSFNNFTKEQQDLIINNKSPEEVEQVLESIKYSELNFITDYADLFCSVIGYSNSSIIKFIDKILKNKIIDKNYIFKNYEVLYNLELFNIFFSNINYLKNIGINLNNLGKYYSDIFLIPIENISKQISILNEYNINLYKDDLYDFEMIKSPKILNILDNFIELGLEDFIINNPQYLKEENIDIIKRIIISNLIGVKPLNDSNRLKGYISTGDKFFVEKSKYDNFIIDYTSDYLNDDCYITLNDSENDVINSSIKNMPPISKLDENFKRSELTYEIEGIIISRNRVIRNLETLLRTPITNGLDLKELIFQAIIYNMVTNIEPSIIENIREKIYSLYKNKVYEFKSNKED